MDKLRLKFSKTGRAVYLSHLDLMRTMQRVFSRAGVPLKYSEGFNPHAKISIILPLSVGTASLCEYMDFALTEDRDLSALPEALNAYMPEGIEALEAYEAPCKGAELRWLMVEGVMKGGRDAAFYTDFFAQDTIPVTRKAKRGMRTDDIAPAIQAVQFSDVEGGVAAKAILHAQDPTVSPELMMAALGEDAPAYWRFTRMEAFQEDLAPFR